MTLPSLFASIYQNSFHLALGISQNNACTPRPDYLLREPKWVAVGAIRLKPRYSDFPQGEGESKFLSRFHPADIAQDIDGRRVLGFAPFEVTPQETVGGAEVIKKANKILANFA